MDYSQITFIPVYNLFLKIAILYDQYHPVNYNVYHQVQKALVKHFSHVVLTNGINLI